MKLDTPAEILASLEEAYGPEDEIIEDEPINVEPKLVKAIIAHMRGEQIGDRNVLRLRLEAKRASDDGEFKKAWDATGYEYGAEALENVKVGWRLARSVMADPDMRGGEAALAIGEHAFKAGVSWAVDNINTHHSPRNKVTLTDEFIHDGWSAYEPPEEIKALS